MICSAGLCTGTARWSVSIACRPRHFDLSGYPREIERHQAVKLCDRHRGLLELDDLLTERQAREMIGAWMGLCERNGDPPPEFFYFWIVHHGIS
ncbi:MAG: hypothetical protein ACLFWF_10900 [Alphaproteobacteria bacterium]